MTARLPLAAFLTSILVAPGLAQDDVATVATVPTTPQTSASLTLTLESQGNIERTVVNYLCDNDRALSVQYINAAPNFLAIVPVEGQNLVFATTLSASGARYVSGPYEWWSHQGEATLRDLMQDEDAEPLATCTEVSNTP
ncbi:MliC family protein [Devosia sp. XK-2]|uniref:MliC family protein n=1 Tax=Devosia sp. XK-2 TaxID=3126689 RepID=UPI0030D3D9AE